MLGGQGVVLAHFFPSALRAAPALASIVDSSSPFVQVAIWTLVTLPPGQPVAVKFDDNRAKVFLCSMVPLFLQNRIQQANIWSCCLCILQGGSILWINSTATYAAP